MTSSDPSSDAPSNRPSKRKLERDRLDDLLERGLISRKVYDDRMRRMGGPKNPNSPNRLKNHIEHLLKDMIRDVELSPPDYERLVGPLKAKLRDQGLDADQIERELRAKVIAKKAP